MRRQNASPRNITVQSSARAGISSTMPTTFSMRMEPTAGLTGKRINNPNTHGTGCTLSSAIASNLAKGFSLEESVERAKDYISGALAAMLDLGKGSGPMDHGFAIDNAYTKEAEV